MTLTPELPTPQPERHASEADAALWGNPTLLTWNTAMVGAIALIAICGYIFNQPSWKSVLPGAVEMKSNTAFALLASAAGLYLLVRKPSRLRLLATLLGAGVLLCGQLTLLEYLFNWHLGIDELVFRDAGGPYAAYPGRMSPYSAASFVAFGATLLMLNHLRLRPLALIGAVVTVTTGLTSLLGYALSARELTTDQWVPPVAVHTAAAFVLLGITVIIECRPKSLVAMLEALAARGHVEYKVLVGFGCALFMLVVGGAVTYRLQVNFAAAATFVSERQRVHAELNQLYAAVADAESAQRGYLLTGAVKHLQRYRFLAARVGDQEIRLQASYAERSAQLGALTALRDLVAKRMEVLERDVGIFDREGYEAARRVIAADSGIAYMSQIQALIDEMNARDARVVQTRSQEIERDRSYTLAAMLATLALATVTFVVLFGSIVRDIREKALIAAALDLAQREAQRATAAKSEFLASMSHEIRTPMNGVIGMLELLQQSSLIEQQREMVDLTRESADALLTIIDDILDFSKIEAGKLEIDHAPINVRDVVEKTCSLLNRLAERRATTLRVFCDPAIPVTLVGDATRLRQILINLTNNAIKFSSGLAHLGQVSVRAGLIAGRGPLTTLEFRVTDNGIGMDEATVAKLFSSFTQADASTTRRYGGTGLGLAICKRLTELMGGSIGVQTAPGMGSTFTVQLPFEVAESASPDAARALFANIENIDCLVLGEGDGLADDIATYLASARARVSRTIGVNDSRAWSARASTFTVWVIVADELPALTTILPAMHSRADPSVRVLIVTLGRNSSNPDASAGDFVTIDGNALTQQSLLTAVAIAAGRQESAPKKAAATPQALRPLAPSRAQAVRRHQLILVAEDNEMNCRVISEQLAMLGYAADFAGNGRDAFERWKTGDYALLFTDLHMPEMDGCDLTLAIRVAEAGGARIPIVALTANALQGEVERCRKLGMDDYLTKPAPLAALRAVTDRYLPLDTPSEVPTALLAGPESSAALETLDVAILKALIGEDETLVREFLAEYRAGSAQLAKDILAAIDADDSAAATSEAHKLKSSARCVGASPLGDLCEAIEQAGLNAEIGVLRSLAPRLQALIAAVDVRLEEALAAPRIGDRKRA